MLPHASHGFRLAAKPDRKDLGTPASALVVYRREVSEEGPDLPWKRIKVIPLK